jgi:putative membrane protein
VGILITWLANSLAILFAANFLGGVSIRSTSDAFIAGAVLSLVNALVRPVLVLLTLPVTIVSLGLFYFVITGFCLWLTAYVLPGFAVHGILMTIFASVVISVIRFIVSRVLTTASAPPRDRTRR